MPAACECCSICASSLPSPRQKSSGPSPQTTRNHNHLDHHKSLKSCVSVKCCNFGYVQTSFAFCEQSWMHAGLFKGAGLFKNCPIAPVTGSTKMSFREFLTVPPPFPSILLHKLAPSCAQAVWGWGINWGKMMKTITSVGPYRALPSLTR